MPLLYVRRTRTSLGVRTVAPKALPWGDKQRTVGRVGVTAATIILNLLLWPTPNVQQRAHRRTGFTEALLLATYYLLLATYYSLLTTYYLLLTAYYLLLTTHRRVSRSPSIILMSSSPRPYGVLWTNALKR